MQQSPTKAVYTLMKASMKLLVLAVCVVGLTACASTETTDRNREPDISQIAETIGCRPDEVAVCIEVNCELEEYACTNRADVKDMFKAGEFRH